MDKKKGDQNKATLTSAQQVTYSHQFKAADRAAGYTPKRNR
ncbi:YfhE family protein [Rossellomorea marisflavi]|nr:YfhE family protein [Rossellomorea marisflavi]MCM2591643.1 YfhE family protein [Rossellomorea marisflavi]